MGEFASRGVGTAGLTTGIIGTAGWLLNGGLGGLLGGNAAAVACSDNMAVNRYELHAGPDRATAGAYQTGGAEYQRVPWLGQCDHYCGRHGYDYSGGLIDSASRKHKGQKTNFCPIILRRNRT